MPTSTQTFDAVNRQNRYPVLIRGSRMAPLVIRLPYRSDNRDWLRGDNTRKPKWLPEHRVWQVPKAWFDDVIRRSILRFGAIYVIQPFRASETCAPACWNATGAHCECSCMGEHHGSQAQEGRWHVVSETFAVRHGPREFACRLLRAPRQAAGRRL